MEFFRLFHQAQCFSVTFRLWHTKTTGNIFLGGLSLFLDDYRYRTAMKHGHTAHDGTVIAKLTVAMQFPKIGKQKLDIIRSHGAVILTG